MEFETLWTVKELARFLAISERKVFYKLARSQADAGSVPHIKIDSAIRFVPGDIRLWIEWGCPCIQSFMDWKRIGKKKVG